MPPYFSTFPVSIPSNTPVHVVENSCDTHSLSNGDLVEGFGYQRIWDASCVRDCVVKKWRTEGDSICDKALEELSTIHGNMFNKDLYAILEEHVFSSPSQGERSAAVAFWEEIHALPPSGLRATESSVRLAQNFFVDNATQILQSLLYFSLAGGFASPRIMRTLQSVSYLVSSEDSEEARNRTYQRLLETFQFVLDIMGCYPSGRASGLQDLMPGGEGWKSIVRVRMLHGIARRRASDRLYGTSDNELNPNVPISQEDVSATLSSFSTVPLIGLNHLGLRPSSGEANAYLTLWRHVGFYFGVKPEILLEYFLSVEASESFLMSMVIHEFTPDTDQDPQAQGPEFSPTLSILRAVSNRQMGGSYEYNCAAARHFLGAELSERLYVPKTSQTQKIRLKSLLAIQWLSVQFGRMYGWARPGWLGKRRRVMSIGMPRVVRSHLGMRRTKYRPVHKESRLDDKALEDESIVPDYAGGIALTRVWREVIAEMVVTCVLSACIPVAVVWYTCV